MPSGAVLRVGTVRLRHPHMGSGFHVAFTPDGRYLLARGGQDGVIRVWDTTVSKDAIALPGAHAWAVSPDSRTVSLGGDGAAVPNVLYHPGCKNAVRLIKSRFAKMA